ncbi:hypothetical protein GOODEAATRI_021718 [Goodea atripinnis]|uniref:Basal body-orientation factor 1 n=1 Tax=Goodea atripinnis TaxID=208336 RepID=A0ABV0MU35_9TELE
MATNKTKQGRGRKTNNDVKPLSKQEKKQNAKVAEVNSDLWELKLKRTEQDLALYQKAHHNMLDHEKAIAKLESELKQAYTEKNCLSEKLQNADAELEDLKNLAQSLCKDKLALAVDKKILTSTLKENIAEMALEEKTLTEVKAKAASLERALKKMEEETREKEKRNQVTIQASEVELDKLQKIIAMREKEIHHIKQLARTIVEKRKDMEVFFHEALDHIRQEIADDRKRYKREAYQDYRQKFREDTARRTRLPPIRTFHQSPNSTNSVYSDMKAVDKEVYISDLTWEQKEKVLTLLFAKMNGYAESEVNRSWICESCRKQSNLLTPKPLNKKFSNKNVH